MPRFVVDMRPPKGQPQEFTDSEGNVRPLMRSITLEAADRDEARMVAERQAWDIHEESKGAAAEHPGGADAVLVPVTPRYVVKSITAEKAAA